MKLNDSSKYQNEIKKTASLKIEWDKLRDKTFVVTGATGLIGKYLIDTIMYKNKHDKLNCTVIAVGRSKEKIIDRFEDCYQDKNFKYYEVDLNEKIKIGSLRISFFHFTHSPFQCIHSSRRI